VRVIVLLLAVIMMTGAMTQPASASPGVVTAVEPASDIDTPVMPEPVVLPAPERRAPVRIEAPPASTCGRTHAVLVFRPPRLVASR
jgi:hypothetical protein